MPSVETKDGVELHYDLHDFTDPWRESEVLILQHGFGRSGRFWFNIVPYLARYYRIICPDLRGLGRSGWNAERDLAGEDYTSDLISIADHVEARTFHYLGESLGGTIGLYLAAEHPSRVRTLSLLAAPIYINEWLLQNYAVGHGSWSEALQTLGAEGWARASNNAARFPPETDPRLLEWYTREIGKSDVRVLTAMTRVAATLDATACLARIQAPVLALYPSAGQIATDEQRRTLTEGVAKLHTARLQTSYQMLHMLEPAACAERVLHFLALHDGVVCHE